MIQIRHDRSPLAAPVKVMIYEGVVARVHLAGDPLVYPQGPEYRRLDSLAEIPPQLAGKPLILHHPIPEAPHWGLVAQGAPHELIGQVLGGRLDGNETPARILVDTQTGLDAIAAGIYELSLGYVCDLDENRNQINIRIDHLALVPRARCGEQCALRTDCAAEIPCSCKNRAMLHNVSDMHVETSQANPVAVQEVVLDAPVVLASPAQDEAKMDELQAKLTAALAEIEAQKALVTAADKAKLDADIARTNAERDLASEKTRADKALQDLATEKTRADATVEAGKFAPKLDAASDEFRARVNARVALESTAARILGIADDKGVRIDRAATSDREIKLAVIKHIDGDEVRADAVDAFVDGVFDGAVRRHDRATQSTDNVRGAIAQTRIDGAKPTISNQDAEAEAMSRAAADLAGAWRK